MKKERNIGIDLLRILSMFFVVLLHVLGNGGILNHSSIFSINYEIAWFLEIIAYCAVNCYALISGYVGVSSNFKYSNIIQLWFRTFFYTFFISIIFFVFVPETFSISNVVKSFFPVLSNQYWYFTSYFCMFFFIPYFNILLNKLSKKMASYLITTIISLFCVFAMISPTDIFNLSAGYSVIWLSLLYLIGGYIKKYNIFQKWSNRKLLLGFLSCAIFTWVSKLIIEIVTLKLFGSIRGNMLFIQYNSITILLEAIFLLTLFSRLKINKAKRLIVFLAPLSFSVYLIHAHPFIWELIINNSFAKLVKFPFYIFPLLVFGVALLIYLMAITVDAFRSILFKEVKVKRISEDIVEKIKSLEFLHR